MQKRGQITLFVVLGIILISVLAIGLYFKQQIAVKEASGEIPSLSSLPPDLELLKEEISDCTRMVSEEALYFIGQQGGYFLPPDDALPFESYNIALGIKRETKTLISEEELKKEIASYITVALPGCVDYLTYTNDGLHIFDQAPVIDVKLNDENTEFSIEYKVTAEKEANTYNLFEPYEISLPYRVKKVYESTSRIADEILQDNAQFDLNQMLTYNMDLDLYNIANNLMVIAVKDRDENNYEFLFGVAL